jgi:hypothetical protein
VQDEINDKTVNLCARVGKVTADEVTKAINKLIADIEASRQGKKSNLKHGKQTLEQLDKHGSGRSSIELSDPNLRLLKREMNKKSVDFSIQKDGKGKYLLFFKGNDQDAMTAAFRNYSRKMVKAAGRPSITSTLAAMKAEAAKRDIGRDKVKNKEKGAR